MSAHAPTSSPRFTPLGTIGRITLAGLAYLGGMALLAGAAVRSLGRSKRAGNSLPLGRAVGRQVTWLISMGLPLVGLVHVGLGSFLSMQAFFGGTFADGTGAVVGVGLVRNIAPLMSGLTLAGLLAARLTSELRSRSRPIPAGSRRSA
jgi:phospholipid/cholesterol/gamma-HCH transport system permease protein